MGHLNCHPAQPEPNGERRFCVREQDADKKGDCRIESKRPLWVTHIAKMHVTFWGQVLDPLKHVHRPPSEQACIQGISFLSYHFRRLCPGSGISVGCDIERILIVDQAINRKLCREGSQVEDVLLCHFGIHDGDSPTPGKSGWGERSLFLLPCHGVTSGI